MVHQKPWWLHVSAHLNYTLKKQYLHWIMLPGLWILKISQFCKWTQKNKSYLIWKEKSNYSRWKTLIWKNKSLVLMEVSQFNHFLKSMLSSKCNYKTSRPGQLLHRHLAKDKVLLWNLCNNLIILRWVDKTKTVHQWKHKCKYKLPQIHSCFKNMKLNWKD